MRMVDQSDWDLSSMYDRDRAGRLLNPPPAEDLIATIAREAIEHAQHPQSFWECESCIVGTRSYSEVCDVELD
jgi:hypothetical protein